VLVIFVLAALAWVFVPLVTDWVGADTPPITDAGIASTRRQQEEQHAHRHGDARIGDRRGVRSDPVRDERVLFKPEIDEIPGGRKLIDDELAKLGTTSAGERRGPSRAAARRAQHPPAAGRAARPPPWRCPHR
jgi:hypothetical protein